jgi:autotransporter translocation and assembly factor TamB
MRVVRRSFHVVALIGTILVGVIAVALIVSQTPWFRDWVRRYVVRESKQYLNGELTIGKLGGNLFFGVQLSDVAVDLSGERVVAVKDVEVDYSIFTLLSKGIVLDEIKLVEPALRLEQTSDGWNIKHLVKEQRKEAEREGPRRPLSLQSIEIADGSLTIESNHASDGYDLPTRIRDLDVRAQFEYAPVHYSIGLQHVSFRADSPSFTLQELKGDVAVRDDNLYLEQLRVRTPESSVTVDGVVEHYLQTPVLQLTTTGEASLPEFSKVLPPVSGYGLHPWFDVKANGPVDRLALDLNVKSEAGNLAGQVTADLKAPELGVKGRVNVERLDLAQLLKDPKQKSDITGLVAMDLSFAPPQNAQPFFSSTSGTFDVTAPHAAALGYEARNIRATGTLDKGRITLQAKANAYGASATAAGLIVPPASGRLLAVDLRGSVQNLKLANLPAFLRVPKLETNLFLADYHVQGTGRRMKGTATLNRSEVEGAIIADGTVAEFDTTEVIAYGGRGDVSNLNLMRIGKALNIEVLSRPDYDSQVNGRFDVHGSGTTLRSLRLDASGTVTDTAIMGARLDNMSFVTRIADSGLDVKVRGPFEHLDLGRVTGRHQLAGQVTGTADASLRLADLTQPVTPETIEAAGQIVVGPSIIGALQVLGATVEGTYRDLVGDITRVEMKGPDLTVNASGKLALNRTSSSSVKYHIEATNLTELGKLVAQERLDGSAIVDGTLTGNAVSLESRGTINGANVSYGAYNALDLNTTVTVSVPELTLADAKVETDLAANFVKVAGLEIKEAKAKATYAQKQLDFSTTLKQEARELTATGDVIFHPDHQEIHLPELAIRTAGQEWRNAPGAATALQYGGDKLKIVDLKLVSGDQTLAVDGEVALKGDEPSVTSMKVNASNVDLAQAEKLFLQDRGLSGRLTAQGTIGGSTSQPSVDGHVEVVDGGFRTYKYQSLEADVDYKGNRIDLNATLQQSATERITAVGTMPISLFRRGERGHVEATAEDRVDVRVTSTDLGLGFIQGFTTMLANVTGTLQADVRILGSGADPHVEGHVVIRNGAFGVPLGGVSYTGLDTRIELQPDVVRIQEFTLRDDHGRPLSVSGQLAVHERNVGAVDMNLTSSNFEIIDNQLGDVGLDTKLKITGELRSPRVEGNVRVAAGRLEIDEILQLFYDPYKIESQSAVVSADRLAEESGSARDATRRALEKAQTTGAKPSVEVAAEQPAAASGPFAPVALNVRVNIPDNLVLRGTDLRPSGPNGAAFGDLNITVGGDLDVQKEPNNPIKLVGVVRTIRGSYEFQGRAFELLRDGTIRFTGDMNPLVDVTARRNIPNTGVEARVHIKGLVQSPTLELTSTPPLEESDILSLIIFNRPVNELGTGERASLAATAGGIATGFLAAPLGQSIGRALDLDLFEITTTTESGELGAGITIGQQIGDRAFFKVRQEFGDRNLSEFLLEYQISSFLRIHGSAAPETSGSANRIGERRIERAGMDLIFFFSY